MNHGRDRQRGEKPDSGKNVCGAGDRLTELFCKGVRQQDKAAMNEFLEEALKLVTDVTARRLEKRDLSRGFAEIVACESLLKAIRHADKFDCKKPIMAWVFGIVSNEIVNCIRAEKAFDLLSLDQDGNGNDGSGNGRYRSVRDRKALKPPDELVLREEETQRERDLAALNAAIPQLPMIERQVIELRRAGEPNYIIAKTLGIKSNQVAAIYFKAKKELRRRIG